MPHKMLSCICGNTELEKVGVNLLRSNDAESLELVALLCRGNGCGRVTFRPGEAKPAEAPPRQDQATEVALNAMPKSEQPAPRQSRESLKQLIAVFEQAYTDRLVYKAVAERDPGCSALVEALKRDDKIRERIARTFTPLYECVERDEDFMKVLESLPSMGSNGGEKPLAATKNGY